MLNCVPCSVLFAMFGIDVCMHSTSCMLVLIYFKKYHCGQLDFLLVIIILNLVYCAL